MRFLRKLIMRYLVSIRPMWLAAAALLMMLPLTGCKKSAAQQASESDANGYLCAAGHKSYTDRSVFADQCPVCQTVALTPVYGFVCEKSPAVPVTDSKAGCGEITLAPRGKSTECKKCGRTVSAICLPSGRMLAEWGAIKATRQQVSLK